MKCPKCDYLGFEAVDRCRNCGYEFSLTPAANPPELPMKSETDEGGSLDDLALIDAAAVRRPPPSSELPLFGPRVGDEGPLITKPSPPRAPLSVRRATPEVPKLRAVAHRAPLLDLGPPQDSNLSTPDSDDPLEAATLYARMSAVAIDLFILAAIDAVVIYFTMQICGLSIRELGVLRRGPLVAFLLFQNGGYLVAFTAGGQTLGKMAAGIKIVSVGSDEPVDLGRSVLRTLVWVLLVLPIGLGFLTTLLSADRRGLHDRCAGTRVIRATA